MLASEVTVLISTFGDEDRWGPMALAAMESLFNQTKRPRTVWSHRNDLQAARNDSAARAETEWLIFLDADDSLNDCYVEAMIDASGDIRRPSMQMVCDGVAGEPFLPPEGDLMISNFIPIGAMIRHDLFDQVGGFRDLPALEDWALWRDMVKIGATIDACPEAVYRVTVRPDGRNSDRETHNRIYQMLRAED